MGILGDIVTSIAEDVIGNNLDKPIKALDKASDKVHKKLFEVKDGKKIMIVNEIPHTLKDIMSVFDEDEKVKYKIKGEFTSIKRHLHIYDIKDIEVGEVKEKLIALRNPLSMQTKIADFDFIINGKRVAKVKSKSFLKDKLELDNGWLVKGNITGFKYSIYNEKEKEIANVSQKLLYYGLVYKIEYDEDTNELFILMIFLAMFIYNAPSKKEKYKDSLKYHLWH